MMAFYYKIYHFVCVPSAVYRSFLILQQDRYIICHDPLLTLTITNPGQH